MNRKSLTFSFVSMLLILSTASFPNLLLHLSAASTQFAGAGHGIQSPAGPPSVAGFSPDAFATTTSTPVGMLTGFNGLNSSQAAALGCNSPCPADNTLAAGPSHIVEIVNTAVGVFSKQGILVKSLSFFSFFVETTTNHDFTDPKILYDAPSGRWFATAIDVYIPDESRTTIKLAVSTTGDPTGTWKIYTLSPAHSPDQPMLGVSDDKVIVSAATCFLAITGCGGGGEVWAYYKNDLLSGVSTPGVNFFGADQSLPGYLFPVQSLTSTKTEYMASSSNSGIKLFSITGVPGKAILSTSTNLSANPIVNPPQALSPGCNGGCQIYTGDSKVRDAVWSNGKLWLSLNDGCTPPGDSLQRSCARLIEIDTTALAVVQDFDIGAIGFYYFYPALRPDSTGNLDIIFGFSSNSLTCCYPSLAITGQGVNDPINSVANPVTIVSGSGIVTEAFGDYFGAGVDPSASTEVWVVGEYCPIRSCGWNSFIASMVIGGGGSVAPGTLITLADGSQVPVQNLKVGVQLLSYDMTARQYVTTTIARFVSVMTHNQMVIQTSTGKPLIVDKNPAQTLYVMFPNGTWTLLPVTELKVGYNLFEPATQTWVPITDIQYQGAGNHVMYDIYPTAPGNYIANGYLDPHKT